MNYVPMFALCGPRELYAGANRPAEDQPESGGRRTRFPVAANSASDRVAVKLSDFRGKKIVILAFFPAAFTGG